MKAQITDALRVPTCEHPQPILHVICVCVSYARAAPCMLPVNLKAAFQGAPATFKLVM